jgi:hypothetical protein
MIHLPRVLTAAGEIQKFCQQRGWRFCFIDGVAVQRWGEPRMTQDLDLTLLTGFGNEASFADALLRVFTPRRNDAREFAMNHRILLARTADGVDADIAFGALPFEDRSIQRASPWEWAPGQSITTCSAEDLVVHKAFAGRDLDWGDVERILTRQHAKLDLNQIRSELRPLLELKEDPGPFDKLERMVASVDHRLRENR